MSPTAATGAVSVPRRRRRPPRSCVVCRRRKVRCNQEQPCSNCVSSKSTCSYDNGSSQPFVYSSIAQHLTTPVATPTSASSVSASDVNHAVSLNQQHELTKSLKQPIIINTCSDDRLPGNSQATSLTSETNNESEIEELRQRVKVLESLLTTGSNGDVTRSKSVTSLGSAYQGHAIDHATADPRLDLNKGRFFGASHWSRTSFEYKPIASALNVDSLPAVADEAVTRLKSEIPALLKTCKMLAKSSKACRPSRCTSLQSMDLLSMDKESANHLIKLYFSHFESVFRILHAPSFFKAYEEHCMNPAGSSIVVQLKISLAISLGLSLDKDILGGSELRSTALRSLHTAQTWLAGPLEKSQLSIDVLQVQCLLVLARQALSYGGDLIWVTMGTLVRSAMQMGLNRDPSHFNGISIFEAETRRRLWATILELDIQSALGSGMPPGITSQDYDTEPPSNIDDEDIDNNRSICNPRPAGQTTDTSLQRFLYQNLPVRLRILQIMNNVIFKPAHDEVLAVTAGLIRACVECSLHIHRTSAPGVGIFRYNLADLLLRRFLLCLHRPLANRALSDPRFYHSRKMCLDSALALLSPTPNEEFRHLLLLGGGLFKNRIIHVSLALCSELLFELNEQKPNGNFSAPSSYRRMLIEALKEARCQLTQRMELGETNVRMYMKLGVVLCRAESTATGHALQKEMMQSAAQSLREASAILQTLNGDSDSSLWPNDGAFAMRDLAMDDLDLDFDFGDIFYAGGTSLDVAF